MGEEQLLSVDGDLVGDADEAEVAAGAGGPCLMTFLTPFLTPVSMCADLGEEIHQQVLYVVAGGALRQEEDRFARRELGQLRAVHTG